MYRSSEVFERLRPSSSRLGDFVVAEAKVTERSSPAAEATAVRGVTREEKLFSTGPSEFFFTRAPGLVLSDERRMVQAPPRSEGAFL